MTGGPAQGRLPAVDPLRGLHHVALTVSDVETSARWYADVLGLSEDFRESAGARRAVVLHCPATAISVGLVQHDCGPERFDPRRMGLDHLAFAVGSREALAEWERRLDEHGVTHSGVVDVPPGAILNFKDPDGIALALFWDRP